MITIFNRIFPEDISKSIYNFVIQDYIKYVLIGKIFTKSLIIEKHYNNFNTIVNKKMMHYDIGTNYTEIVNVCKFLKYMKTHFIEKKYYSYDHYMNHLIQDFKKIIFYIGENENHILIKNYFKLIYNEI
jgi:hypothetical protein